MARPLDRAVLLCLCCAGATRPGISLRWEPELDPTTDVIVNKETTVHTGTRETLFETKVSVDLDMKENFIFPQL